MQNSWMRFLWAVITILFVAPAVTQAQDTYTIVAGHGVPSWLKFIDDDRHLVVFSGNNTAWLYDAATLEFMGPYVIPETEQPDPIAYPFLDPELRYQQLSPDGSLLMQWELDGSAKIWDLATNELLRERFPDINPPYNSDTLLYWMPDSRYLLICFRDMTTTCIPENAETGEAGSEIPLGEIAGPIISPDRRYFPAWDGLYDAFTFEKVQQFDQDMGGTLPIWSPDSGKIAFPSYYVRNVRIYDIDAGRMTHEMERPLLRYGARYAAWSADGLRLATVDDDGLMILWDIETGEEIIRSTDHKLFKYDVAFTDDETLIAVASGHGEAAIYDTTTGHLLLNIQAHTAPIYLMQWQPGGRLLATASADGWNYNKPLDHNLVHIWDGETGELVDTLTYNYTVRSIAWHPTGAALVSTDGDTAQVWDAVLRSTRGTLTLDANYQLASMSWSPNGNYILADQWTDNYRLWNAETLEIIAGRIEYFPGSKGVWSEATNQMLRADYACLRQNDCGIFVRVLFDPKRFRIEEATDYLIFLPDYSQSSDFLLSPKGTHLVIEDGDAIDVWQIEDSNPERIMTRQDVVNAGLPTEISLLSRIVDGSLDPVGATDRKSREKLSPSGRFAYTTGYGVLHLRPTAP